jgi:hypothetical protein
MLLLLKLRVHLSQTQECVENKHENEAVQAFRVMDEASLGYVSAEKLQAMTNTLQYKIETDQYETLKTALQGGWKDGLICQKDFVKWCMDGSLPDDKPITATASVHRMQAREKMILEKKEGIDLVSVLEKKNLLEAEGIVAKAAQEELAAQELVCEMEQAEQDIVAKLQAATAERPNIKELAEAKSSSTAMFEPKELGTKNVFSFPDGAGKVCIPVVENQREEVPHFFTNHKKGWAQADFRSLLPTPASVRFISFSKSPLMKKKKDNMKEGSMALTEEEGNVRKRDSNNPPSSHETVKKEDNPASACDDNDDTGTKKQEDAPKAEGGGGEQLLMAELARIQSKALAAKDGLAKAHRDKMQAEENRRVAETREQSVAKRAVREQQALSRAQADAAYQTKTASAIKIQSQYRTSKFKRHLRTQIMSCYEKLYDAEALAYYYQHMVSGGISWGKPLFLGQEDIPITNRSARLEQLATETAMASRMTDKRTLLKKSLLKAWNEETTHDQDKMKKLKQARARQREERLAAAKSRKEAEQKVPYPTSTACACHFFQHVLEHGPLSLLHLPTHHIHTNAHTATHERLQ